MNAEQVTSDLPLLWAEHRSRLRSYIAQRVRDPSVADDILQDVFLKAHLSLHTLKSRGSVTAWLYRIAANAIADYYRGLRPFEVVPEELAAPEPEPDYLGELALCLQPLIDDLPEAYRLALMLSEIEGQTLKDVAATLGLSLSGAKSRVQRGRVKLRERIMECCNIEIERGAIVGYELRDKK